MPLKRENQAAQGMFPAVEPQHFKKGATTSSDTYRTGEDHPLPIGNYAQNASGIWLPVSPSNPMSINGDVNAQLTGRKVKYVISDASISSDLAPGSSEVAVIYATSGWLAKVSHLYLHSPAIESATSGTHRIIFGIGNTNGENRVFTLQGSYNETLTITPSNFTEIANRLNAGFYIGDENDTRFFIYHENQTDAVQTASRTFKTFSIEEKVII